MEMLVTLMINIYIIDFSSPTCRCTAADNLNA